MMLRRFILWLLFVTSGVVTCWSLERLQVYFATGLTFQTQKLRPYFIQSVRHPYMSDNFHIQVVIWSMFL